ncbi:MAG: pantoate kinase [Promethearchaeota archaeon]|jgi:pantoate kinase
MAPYKKEVIVDVPHRISGFFEIIDEINGKKISNPIKIGSRGAGFNLSAVGMTKIKVEELNDAEDKEIEIFINNERVDQKAETTYFIYNDLKRHIKNAVKISIFHNFDLPVGCGYGASGSGALGAIYGLNQVFNLKLPSNELGKRAHIAEVINRTGLGTVCGQLRGGLCILREPGYPCDSERIPIPNNLKVICGSFGMIHTKSILTDPVLNRKIKEAGRKAQITLINNPNIKSFMEASMQFVEDSEILDILDLQELKKLIQRLNNLNIMGASMNQLGNSVYAICKKEEEGNITEILESYMPKIKIFKSSINLNGPRILNK